MMNGGTDLLDTITVYNDEGEEAEFYVVEQTQINGSNYLLASESEDEDEVDAWIFKQIKTEDDELIYETIDDEAELDAVMRVFGELLEDCDIEL